MWPWRRRRGQSEPAQDVVGGPVIRGPERAYFQRLSGDYSSVSSNGKLTLTETELRFNSRIGTDVVVPLGDVVDARDQTIHRAHLGGHDSQLVVKTASGEIGFLLDDPAGWAAALSSVSRRPHAPDAP